MNLPHNKFKKSSKPLFFFLMALGTALGLTDIHPGMAFHALDMVGP
jgi:hypothetical protein